MPKKSSIAVFIAATSALAISTSDSSPLKAEEIEYGTKEWNTDMPLDAEYILDEKAQQLADEREAASGGCIPIGEGENCW
tara:strand:- start:433 stop:672 length:240 start_codon:yes stop_codon:yes gene_type:complete